jgi:hypothetical protein
LILCTAAEHVFAALAWYAMNEACQVKVVLLLQLSAAAEQ